MKIKSNKIVRIVDTKEFLNASSDQLIKLEAAPGRNPIMVPKKTVEAIGDAILKGKSIHLTGPTGVAKTALIIALEQNPKNFKSICAAKNYPYKPLKIYHTEAVEFETPGEIFYRRAIRDGNTFDQDSSIVSSLREAEQSTKTHYNCLFIKEIGRMSNAQAFGGLLNLLDNTEVVLPDSRRICTKGLCMIADSNYGAEYDGSYVLHQRDEAGMRRFNIHLRMENLPPENEKDIVANIINDTPYFTHIDEEAIDMAVRLGNIIRRQRMEGNLPNVIPPTIDSYLSYLTVQQDQPYLEHSEIADMVYFGAASSDERKQIVAIVNQVLGQTDEDEQLADINFY